MKPTPFFPLRRIFLLVTTLLGAGTAQAETLQDAHLEVGTVVVSDILPDRLESVPGSFAVIDEDELAARQPFSIKESLNQVPGVHIVGEDTFGLGLNIGVRGLNPRRSSRTLLLEDGMPLFLAPYGDPSAHYSTPLERVHRIEVVKGSGQTLYGPQTVGGMINFVTKPVPSKFGGRVTAMVGNNDFKGGHANVGTGGEWGGIMIDLLQKTGDGVRDNHDFDVREATVKGQLNLTERQTLIAKVGYYEEKSSISETALGSVEYAEDKYQAPTGDNDKFEHERKTLQLQHIFQFDETMKLSTQLYYADSERASFRQINDPGGNNGRSQLDRCPGGVGRNDLSNADLCGGRWRPREFEYWGVEPRLDFSHNLFGIASDAVIGFRYHEEDIERNQFRSTDPRIQSQSFAESLWGVDGGNGHREQIEIDVQAKSYYAQNTFYLGDWSLTPGLRVEDVKIRTDVVRADGQPQDNPESRLTNDQTEVLPGFGVAWNGIENTTVFAGVHQGFAPPRPDRDISTDGANSAVVSRTRPEESTNWELGVRSGYFKGLTFESTLFHTDFDEIVVSDGAGAFVNGGESQQTGIEFAGRLDFGTRFNTAHNFYITASYTNLIVAKFKKDSAAEDIASGDRLPYAPKHLASLNFGYQHPVGIDARIGVDYVSEQQEDMPFRRGASEEDVLSGLTGRIPSYTLFNASVNFKPMNSPFSYFLSGHNLGDREYLVSRVDGMVAGRGRQIFSGIRYDF